MTFLNLRSHRKLLLVDGRTAFCGGLNIGDENLASAKPARRVRDTHFLIAGPVVAQLMLAFTEDWLFSSGETLDGPAWFPDVADAGPAPARVITSGPDHDVEKLEFVIMGALAAARRSVHVATPYFLPDDRICSALELAALRGVEVDIVIPESSDHPTLDWATRAQIGPLLQAGCRIWLTRPPFNHAKLMSIDGIWSLIGSANWDVRSYRLNFELDLEFYDDALANEVARTIADGMQQPLTLAAIEARSLPIVLRDAAARLFLPYL
jgi:cardiolipin synthase